MQWSRFGRSDSFTGLEVFYSSLHVIVFYGGVFLKNEIVIYDIYAYRNISFNVDVIIIQKCIT